jgi:oligosaccharide repeat unit polymerase
VVWFACVAMAQLRVTELETRWSASFALLVFGGGLAFVGAAALAGGTAGARGRIGVPAAEYRVRRLVTVAIVLAAGGVVGAIYKAHVLGGVPLLSDNPDVVRGRAVQGVDVLVPAWSSALTGGFYLGLWCALAALWLLPSGSSRFKVAGLWLFAAAALFGVALDASRNLVLVALAVPLTAAYLLARPRRQAAQLVRVGAVVGVIGLLVGGVFAVRLSQAGSSGQAYITRELDRHSAVVRPLLPLYINAAFPLEAEERIYRAVPAVQAYGLGANSLTSLPDRAFPKGKAPYTETVGQLMGTNSPDQLTWTVATYQGRLFADLGPPGVVLGSLLLGIAFGALYRWARARSGFLPVAMVGYLAYYAAFMVYDNLLSFTLIAVYDLGVILLVDRYARAESGGRVAPIVRSASIPG